MVRAAWRQLATRRAHCDLDMLMTSMEWWWQGKGQETSKPHPLSWFTRCSARTGHGESADPLKLGDVQRHLAAADVVKLVRLSRLARGPTR